MVGLARRELEHRRRPVLVRDHAQEVVDAVDARGLLVVTLDDVPPSFGDVRVDEHLVLRPRELDPVLARLQIHRAELPAAHRVVDPGLEAALLLFVAHREPVLQQDDPVFHEHPLEDRGLAEEAGVLLRGAEAHHRLDAGPVVPAAVEQHDLAGGGEMRDVPLVVPLGLLALGGLRQRRRRGSCAG